MKSDNYSPVILIVNQYVIGGGAFPQRGINHLGSTRCENTKQNLPRMYQQYVLSLDLFNL